jgi:predicted amidohydrolase
MRIGHCQLETKCGDYEGNLAKLVKGLEQAQRERVEVVCFPECFLTGYSTPRNWPARAPSPWTLPRP